MEAGAEWDIRPFGLMAQRLLRLEKGHIIVSQDTDFDAYSAFASQSPLHGALLNIFEDVRVELAASRLERAIGVIYRPDTELASHYFHALLSHQFDEFIWFDHTKAVRPISNDDARRFSSEHPFSLSR